MKGRRLAWPLFGLWAGLTVVACLLQARHGETTNAIVAPALGVLAWVGALLWVRRPANAIGPILLALALLVTLSIALEGAYLGFDADPAPPLGIRLAVWLDQWQGTVWIALVGFVLPLLFPTGKLPSPRWRLLLWGGLVVFGISAVTAALGPKRLEFGERGGFENPLAVGGVLSDLRDVAETTAGVLVLCALASVVVRLARSTGTERQQLKWIAFAFGVLLAGLVAAAVSEGIGWEPLGNVGWTVFLGTLIFGMPVSIALAILRYRLYDIDLVIRRTLIYGGLSVTLAGAYLGSVLLVGLAVGRSGFATAVSTLAVAALFRPARARIQGAVDQRFYRRRYDAALTLEAFGARLRDELDLEALGADLRAVVDETVQPAHVSLWLRSAP